MHRRDFLQFSGFVGGYAALSPLHSLLTQGCTDSRPPNIVLIVVDDQGYADLGCAGLAEDVFTPNINRLAKRGIRFTQAYATSPICSPSRGGLITGCYHQRWGTWWYGGPGLHDPKYRTIPELLRQRGYATGYVGKVHYGSHDAETDHRSFPLNHGFDYYFGHTSARKHYLIHDDAEEEAFQARKEEYKRQGQSLRKQALWENREKVNSKGYSTELFGEKACAFIENHKTGPFFLHLAFNAVHNFTHQLPEEYLKKEGLEGYHDWDPATEEYYDWYKAGRKPNNPEGRAQYLGQLFYLDREIGRVMDYLENNGLDSNTMIIYISDNGGSTPIYADNSPLRGSKYLLYEGGIRVPMMVSWQGKMPENKVLTNVISAMDILPTICSAAGCPVPDYVDGADLSPLLKGTDPELHHDVLVWDTGMETAVRKGKWKLRTATDDNHARYEMVDLELGEFLYDLEKDPGETTNLANAYPEVFAELKRIHTEWREKIGNNQ